MSEREAANAVFSALAAEVEQRGEHRNASIILDEDTRRHILEVAKWLVDGSLPPSLLLYGTVGNGKTSMARAIGRLIEFVSEAENYSKRKRVRFLTAKEICEICAVSEKFKEQYDDYRNVFNEDVLVIDEMGEEAQELLVYGQVRRPVQDLILYRYDRQLMTIMTTNLNEKQLMEFYGQRVYDRFREMAHTVLYTNGSYRSVKI